MMIRRNPFFTVSNRIKTTCYFRVCQYFFYQFKKVIIKRSNRYISIIFIIFLITPLNAQNHLENSIEILDRIGNVVNKQNQTYRLFYQLNLIANEPNEQNFDDLDQALKPLLDKDNSFLDAKAKKLIDLAKEVKSLKVTMLLIPKIKKQLEIELKSVTELLLKYSNRVTENGSYSLETLRQLDILNSQFYKIETQITHLTNMDNIQNIFAVAKLTESLNEVQTSFNQILEGDPAKGIQALRGSADEEVIFEAQYVYRNIAILLANLLEISPELVEFKNHFSKLNQITFSALATNNKTITEQSSDLKKEIAQQISLNDIEITIIKAKLLSHQK